MKFLIVCLSLMISTAAFSTHDTKLDDLIRGELAAMQTYDTVLKDMTDETQTKKLLTIRKDHEAAVTILSKYVIDKPKLLARTESAGIWGDFTKTWTRGAKIMGNKTALKALTQGEEHGVNKYNQAMEDKTISEELKTAIKTKMLPAQEAHIETLKTFL